MDFGAVNKGVVAYLANDTAQAGHAEQDSVFAGAQELLQAVAGLVRESLAIPAHWNTTSPVVGAALMKREMKQRHRQLDEYALDAMAQHFVDKWR